jgi:AraC family transcriptional regulator
MAVTDICVSRPLGRVNDPLPRVDAYMICLMLTDLPNNRYWLDGRQVSAFSLQKGQVTIHDLKREPLALMDKAFRSLLFYAPLAAFNALADGAGVRRINELRYEPGVGLFDRTIKHIGLSVLPALSRPEEMNRLFTDYVTLALTAHVAQCYGGMQTVAAPIKGGLASWQERRSKEMMAGDLACVPSLREIATACGLSISHFSRAFRRSTGSAPHAWLLHARVDSAKAMLRNREPSLSMIALSCGFADRSHFTRVFARHVGLSPGAWRKLWQS